MSMSSDNLQSAELGERLRMAREAVKLTQASAAAAIDMSRTTLVAIEKGQRRVRITELQQLAKLYGTTVNVILRQEAVQLNLLPKFRKLTGDTDPAVENAAKLLSNLVKAEVELENLLGIQRIRQYPQERPILPGDIQGQAELNAMELRQWLGLGIGPISDIVTLLELQLGARVYVRRFDGKISGLFAYDDAVGPCILLNANHPRHRRTHTGAHELGHFISTRRDPEVLDDSRLESAREERYADAFARAFLTPARAVTQKFQEFTAGSKQLTRRHIIMLAHVFGVSREAMVRRLEELKLTKSGTWDWFEANGGITDEQARQVLGEFQLEDPQKTDADRIVSLRLTLLIEEAWRQDLLSEGQLANLLQLDRVEIREILDKLDIEGDEADEAPKLLG
jgi:Zn-dependent peptidase ImmA (M78 family)/DNA-binding XRE family transcriptional regulator